MILVVGGTGLLGGMITQQLLKNGKTVRVLVRHNSPAAELAKKGMATPAEALLAAGAEPVYGDLKDRPSLDKACAGVDTVITTANAVMRGGADTIESVDLNGTKSLIDAAKAAGVSHFIYVSAWGVDVNSPDPLFRAKAVCEGYLQESGLTYTILKPGIFMEVWIGAVVGAPLQAGQPVTLVGKGENRHAFVAIGDVAAYGVTAVDHPAAKNAAIPIASAASYSWTEIVDAVGSAVGSPLPVQHVNPGEPVPLIPESMATLMAVFETYESHIDMGETAATYGIEPTPLAAFAGQFFGGG